MRARALALGCLARLPERGEHRPYLQGELRERADLQEWVRKNPEILCGGIRIVTFEFGAWQARDGHASDRLDLLGLDDDGHLVVVELKRGPAPDTVEMQAIKYAAFASRFTAQVLAQRHAQYLSRVDGVPVSEDESRDQLEAHAGGELDPDILHRAADHPDGGELLPAGDGERGLAARDGHPRFAHRVQRPPHRP